MNRIYLIGNLTHDPELSETASGLPVVNFSLAVNRSYASADGERQTDFFRCTAWRGTAEAIARNVKKGNKLAVNGEIQFRNYEDNQGVKRTATDVIVSDVEFLTPKTNGGAFELPDPPAYMEKKPESADAENPEKAGKKPILQAMDDDSDIPF